MKKTILIAEDNDSYRETMLAVLEMKFPDYKVESFEDGEFLDERLSNGLEGVCAVVTDNEMPGVEGSEIIRRYASANPHIPFILHYGGDEEIGRKAIGNGAYDYVPKLGEKRFHNVLREALSREEVV